MGTESNEAKARDCLDTFFARTQHTLRCPLCSGTIFHACEPGLHQQRVICKGCGHTLWFATAKGMTEEVESGPGIA
jgi:ribosomal protein S27E